MRQSFQEANTDGVFIPGVLRVNHQVYDKSIPFTPYIGFGHGRVEFYQLTKPTEQILRSKIENVDSVVVSSKHPT